MKHPIEIVSQGWLDGKRIYRMTSKPNSPNSRPEDTKLRKVKPLRVTRATVPE
jgi:hypothetical protein